MNNIIVSIDGIQVKVEMSRHAIERAEEREISQFSVMSLITKVGEELLDLKNGEEIAVVDKETGIGTIASVNVDDTDIIIDIITVISNEKIWISRGLKVIRADKMFKQQK